MKIYFVVTTSVFVLWSITFSGFRNYILSIFFAAIGLNLVKFAYQINRAIQNFVFTVLKIT